jgi:hypothetical protein
VSVFTEGFDVGAWRGSADGTLQFLDHDGRVVGVVGYTFHTGRFSGSQVYGDLMKDIEMI